MQTVLHHSFLTQLTVSAGGRLWDAAGHAAQLHGGSHWYVLRDQGSELSPQFEQVLRHEAAIRRDAGIFYTDQQIRREQALDLRPDFDLTMLLAYDYIGLPIAIQADVLVRLQTKASAYGSAFSYALLLFAAQAGVTVVRIPQTMVSRDVRLPPATKDDRRRVLEAWLGRDVAHFDIRPGIPPYAFQLLRKAEDNPPVTFCIPTRQSRPSDDQPPFILGLLETIARLDYPMDRLRVIVGDDLSDATAYSNRPWPFELTRVATTRAPGEPFNYAKKMNRLWRLSETEQIVLMNDDITSDSTDWLQALLTFSMQEDVGGIGARLLYPNGTVQHAGIPGGLFGVCAHAWLGRPAEELTYQDWAVVHREWSIVTGAMFATRRSILEEINGFDEIFSLEFNDVDMCLRLKMLGYRIVYTPHAELIHHEKASRGDASPPGGDLARFLRRWSPYLASDPMFHPKLDHASFAIRPLADPVA